MRDEDRGTRATRASEANPPRSRRHPRRLNGIPVPSVTVGFPAPEFYLLVSQARRKDGSASEEPRSNLSTSLSTRSRL